jgi:endonuclease-3
MALESNGLRVLCRVGFAEEQKNYSATYRLVQDEMHEQVPHDCDSLIRAHQLLRQHGQELCKRSKPRCAECPLSDNCNYHRTTYKESFRERQSDTSRVSHYYPQHHR